MTLGDIIRSYRETNNITLGEFEMCIRDSSSAQ